MKRFAVSLVALALASSPSAQIIVNDGDDLAAIVASAPDDSVIEIHSDGVFAGKLEWQGKLLTIRAGAGYTPTVRGVGTDAAVDIPSVSSPTDTTSAILEGLILESESGPIGMQVSAQNEPVIAQLISCTVKNETRFSSYNDALVNASLDECTLEGEIRSFARATTHVTVRDSFLEGGSVSSQNSGAATATFERCRFTSGVYASTSYATASAQANLRSCLMVRVDGSPVGLSTGLPGDGTPKIFAQNCTITDFVVGLRLNDASDAVNMLVYDNNSDVSSATAPGSVRHSMIGDGSFTGADGNFQADPILDENYALYPCSPGVDAGTSFLFLIELWDLNKDSRYQDGDGDGVATLNVGAVETVVSFPAGVTPFNGSGVNQNAFGAVDPPIIGTTMQFATSLTIDTITTVVGIDLPSPTYLLPGVIDGEVFLALSAALITNIAPLPGGLHDQFIPCEPTIVGASLRAQGFRVLPGSTQALNAVDLVFGTE